MKMTIKLNIGNYQSIDFTTNEYEDRFSCYEEVNIFLFDWLPITDNAKKLKDFMERLLMREEIDNIDPTPF